MRLSWFLRDVISPQRQKHAVEIKIETFEGGDTAERGAKREGGGVRRREREKEGKRGETSFCAAHVLVLPELVTRTSARTQIARTNASSGQVGWLAYTKRPRIYKPRCNGYTYRVLFKFFDSLLESNYNPRDFNWNRSIGGTTVQSRFFFFLEN